jgi:DNA-binding HxlR family transcriptional regulator
MPRARPRPFEPVRGSTTGRPIMALLDLLGRRWSLRVLWELRRGPLSFRALRERCDDVSPSVLAARLAELREVALVELGGDGYALTAQARALGDLLVPLDAWAQRWAAGASRAGPPKRRKAALAIAAPPSSSQLAKKRFTPRGRP